MEPTYLDINFSVAPGWAVRRAALMDWTSPIAGIQIEHRLGPRAETSWLRLDLDKAMFIDALEPAQFMSVLREQAARIAEAVAKQRFLRTPSGAR